MTGSFQGVPMNNIFITGGAGFFGINMTRFLLERGHEVISYDIAEFDYEDCKDKVKVIRGDVRDSSLLFKSMEGADCIIHGAAALPLYPEKEIMTTTVEGTTNVLEGALTLGIKKVIYISSTAVYGIPDHHPLYEEDKLVGVGPYGTAKIKGEEICSRYREKGLQITILRPKSFIGPERLGVFAMLYDWALSKKNFPMIGYGNNRYQLLDVEDLCRAVYLCIKNNSGEVNDVFNIGAKEFATMREDYQSVLDEAGYGKRIIGFPEKPVIMALKILEFFKLSPLYGWVYETAGKDSWVSIEKARLIFGFEPIYSNRDALIRNYKWYVENRESFKDKSGVNHRVPWSQGILKFVKIFF